MIKSKKYINHTHNCIARRTRKQNQKGGSGERVPLLEPPKSPYHGNLKHDYPHHYVLFNRGIPNVEKIDTRISKINTKLQNINAPRSMGQRIINTGVNIGTRVGRLGGFTATAPFHFYGIPVSKAIVGASHAFGKNAAEFRAKQRAARARTTKQFMTKIYESTKKRRERLMKEREVLEKYKNNGNPTITTNQNPKNI